MYSKNFKRKVSFALLYILYTRQMRSFILFAFLLWKYALKNVPDDSPLNIELSYLIICVSRRNVRFENYYALAAEFNENLELGQFILT